MKTCAYPRILFAAALLAGLALAMSSPARMVNVDIAVGNALAFSPVVTNIAAGDSVIWTWQNTVNEHSTTSTTSGAMWDSTLHAQPFTFTNTFGVPGNYPYFCSRHVTFGMTGEVLVASAPLAPPTVGIFSPAPGTVLAAPASVTLQAGVTNGSSAVTNVQFLVGNGVFANLTTGPFTATTNNLAAGSYALSVIATDSNALTATNSIALSVVDPVVVQLTAPAPAPPSGFQFNYSANVGLSYAILRSTNLLTGWLVLTTNQAAANPATFMDFNVPAGPLFYRVARLPNP